MTTFLDILRNARPTCIWDIVATGNSVGWTHSLISKVTWEGRDGFYEAKAYDTGERIVWNLSRHDYDADDENGFEPVTIDGEQIRWLSLDDLHAFLVEGLAFLR